MSFNDEQAKQLLRPINGKRVLHLRGQSHLAGWDVKAHLTRIFGFEGWDKKIRSLELIFEDKVKRENSEQIGWFVTYRCLLTLVIKDPQGNVMREIDGAATGSAENQPQRGEAHDMALKTSVTYALKVCATDLGDQFGLSLYNNGQTKAVVGQVLSAGSGDERDAQDHTPDAVSEDTEPGGTQDTPESASAENTTAAGGAAVRGNHGGRGGEANPFDAAPAGPLRTRKQEKPAEAPPAGPVTDRTWYDGIFPECSSFGTDDEGRTLWRRVNEKAEAGGCSPGDKATLQDLIKARHRELAPQADPVAVANGSAS